MPKQFFTEHDIEDLVKSGVLTLDMTADTVLTDLAYEKARRLGMRLVQPGADTPPGAPIRPYLSQKPVSPTTTHFFSPANCICCPAKVTWQSGSRRLSSRKWATR